MKFVVITKDPKIRSAALDAFPSGDEMLVFEDWRPALAQCQGADILYVDLVATLTEPHKIAGYEEFAEAKMDHAIAALVPLVLFSPPDDYALDYLTGYPDFVSLNLKPPITAKSFRLASGLL